MKKSTFVEYLHRPLFTKHGTRSGDFINSFFVGFYLLLCIVLVFTALWELSISDFDWIFFITLLWLAASFISVVLHYQLRGVVKNLLHNIFLVISIINLCLFIIFLFTVAINPLLCGIFINCPAEGLGGLLLLLGAIYFITPIISILWIASIFIGLTVFGKSKQQELLEISKNPAKSLSTLEINHVVPDDLK